MSKFLKDIQDLNAFRAAVAKCEGDVWLRSADGKEEFNMKSKLSEYIALGRLADTEGENYEIYCQFVNDEANLLKYFYDKKNK